MNILRGGIRADFRVGSYHVRLSVELVISESSTKENARPILIVSPRIEGKIRLIVMYPPPTYHNQLLSVDVQGHVASVDPTIT